MLTRLLFAFAALALFAVSAFAQNIPPKLVPPQEGPLVGKYAAKGVQIYVCSVKGAQTNGVSRRLRPSLWTRRADRSPSTIPVRAGEAPDGSKIVGKV